jgi:hypothetical protein
MWKRKRYQFFTNVTYRTCETCLSKHGRIANCADAFSRCDNDCERHVVSFFRRELAYRRRLQKEMVASSKGELERRRLFNAGIAALGGDNEEALSLFAASARYDLYIPEVERLIAAKGGVLRADSDLRRRLLAVFVRAYSDKFGWRRYERLPELMRIARETEGLRRLREMLG